MPGAPRTRDRVLREAARLFARRGSTARRWRTWARPAASPGRAVQALLEQVRGAGPAARRHQRAAARGRPRRHGGRGRRPGARSSRCSRSTPTSPPPSPTSSGCRTATCQPARAAGRAGALAAALLRRGLGGRAAPGPARPDRPPPRAPRCTRCSGCSTPPRTAARRTRPVSPGRGRSRWPPRALPAARRRAGPGAAAASCSAVAGLLCTAPRWACWCGPGSASTPGTPSRRGWPSCSASASAGRHRGRARRAAAWVPLRQRPGIGTLANASSSGSSSTPAHAAPHRRRPAGRGCCCSLAARPQRRRDGRLPRRRPRRRTARRADDRAGAPHRLPVRVVRTSIEVTRAGRRRPARRRPSGSARSSTRSGSARWCTRCCRASPWRGPRDPGPDPLAA